MTRPPEIQPFETYVERGNVTESAPDPGTARNLFDRAQSKFKNMERLGITEITATDYLENIYESIKMLVQAFMALDGFKPDSHVPIIAYAIDHLGLDAETASRFNKYRKLRNDISYRGDIATRRKAEEIRTLFQQLLNTFGADLESRLG